MTYSLPKEEKLRIIEYLISNSPVNEVREVVDDLKKVLGNEFRDEEYEKYVTMFIEANHVFVKAKDGTKTVIGKHCSVDKNEYANMKTGTVVKVNPMKIRETSSEKQQNSLKKEVETYRQLLEKTVERYARKNYVENTYATSVHGANDGDIVIVISASNSNLRNYWSGSWMTKYQFNVLQKTDIIGELKIDVHYFEDGNIKYETSNSIERSLDYKNPDAVAEEVASLISETEADVKSATFAFLDSLDKDAFKALRRFLPVTRQKMRWSVHQTLAGSLT